jgi:hypothetical protein
MYHIFFLHLSVYGHLFFHFLAIAIVLQWTWEWRWLFCTLISFSLDTYQALRLLDHIVVLFLIFRNLQHGCANLHSNEQGVSVPFSHMLTSLCYLLSFLIITFLIQWGNISYLVIFICISLMISNVEHFSYNCWSFCVSFWEMSI